MKSVLKAGTALAGVVSLMIPAAAHAQEQSGFQLEEIVVTAQKRETTLQDTPVAVSAVGGDEIARAQVRDVRDLQTLVPSLIVNQRASASNTSFQLRGISSSTFNFGLEPAVGVFVDGVYRSRNGASINDFLGIERVEVLRGPQSILFGRNTTAGVINYVTKKPEFEFGGEAELTHGNYDATIAKVGLTGPIVEDKLAFRIDGNINKRDGFITDVVRDRDINERDRYGMRGQLYWTPSENASVRLIADYGDIDEQCCGAPFFLITDETQGILSSLGAPFFTDPFNHLTAVDGEVISQIETFGFSGEVEIDFDGFSFNSITAYRDYDEFQNIDPDFSSAPVNRARALDQTYNTFTQEIRFTSTNDGPFQWMVGAFFFDQDLRATNSTVQDVALRPLADGLSFSPDLVGFDAFLQPVLGFSANGSLLRIIEGLNGLPAGTYLAAGSGQQQGIFDQGNRSYSVFAQFDYDLTDRLTLTVGGRFVREEKDFQSDITIDDPFAALNLFDEFAEDTVQLATTAVTAQIVQGGIAAGLPPELAANPAFNPGFANLPALVQQTLPLFQTPALEQGYTDLTALQFFPPAPNVSDELNENEFLFNAILNYEVNDDLTVYGSYSEGFKAGGFALDSAAIRVGDFQFDSESARSWEVGAKARLFDNRAFLNLAIFDQEVQDFQANTFAGSAFVPNNAGSIEVQGLEVDAAYQVTPEFNLSTAIAWLWKAEYGEFDNGPCPPPQIPVPGCVPTQIEGSNAIVLLQDLAGARLSEQPKLRATGIANYNKQITDNLEFFARTEVQFTGAQELSTSLDPRQVNDSYFLVGASFGIADIEGDWSIQFWGRNILDEEYILDTFETPLPGNLSAYLGDPMTYGVTLRTNF